jgi:molybdate transport system substrate-binding protein
VFAAASLREAFADIGRSLEKREGVTVRFNFGGSDQLATQIVLGAPADVFASADERQMAGLERRGEVAGAPFPFARNRLAVVVPSSNPAGILSIRDLAKRGVRIAIGTRTVPVGRYAREALRAMSADPSFPRDFARRVLANVMSEETDVKAVATKVALGEADAGVVYATDVAPLGTKLRSFPIPGRYARQPTYVIAIVKGASDRQAARRFIAYVTSMQGRAVLSGHGFLPAQR